MKPIARFREILTAGGINVQVRERKGDKIDAACGQLRRTFTPPLLPLVELSSSPSA